MSKQKRKGDGYERELAKFLNQWVFNGRDLCSRAPLSGGGRSFGHGGKADLLGTPFVWAEAKRTERFAPYAAMEQAETGIEGQKNSEIPVVFNRKNGMKTSESLVVMRLGDWVSFYVAFLRELGFDAGAEGLEDEDGHAIEFLPDLDLLENVLMAGDDEASKGEPQSKGSNLRLVVNNASEEEE